LKIDSNGQDEALPHCFVALRSDNTIETDPTLLAAFAQELKAKGDKRVLCPPPITAKAADFLDNRPLSKKMANAKSWKQLAQKKAAAEKAKVAAKQAKTANGTAAKPTKSPKAKKTVVTKKQAEVATKQAKVAATKQAKKAQVAAQKAQAAAKKAMAAAKDSAKKVTAAVAAEKKAKDAALKLKKKLVRRICLVVCV
jgi:hypothetical protein